MHVTMHVLLWVATSVSFVVAILQWMEFGAPGSKLEQVSAAMATNLKFHAVENVSFPYPGKHGDVELPLVPKIMHHILLSEACLATMLV